MELVEGGDLRAALERGGWDLFWDLAIQTASGLAHIHRHGVLHLDLKPENLGLVEGPAGPQIKILDFGLSQSVRGPLDRRIRGTLAYAAPEMLLQDVYDQRADLYSLGLTLFHLATGILPSAGDDLAAIRFHLEAPVPDPLAARPDMPVELAAILRRLLDRDPRRRFPSAGKLAAELRRAAGREAKSEADTSEGTLLASRMVGREPALDALRQALAESLRGEGRVAVIEGAEGMGKSRLVREFRLLAAIEGAAIGVGQARSGGEPLRPVLEALRRVGVDVDSALTGAPTTGEQTERYRFYQSLAGAVALRARSSPGLVLAVEDFHLAAREAHELLAYLMAEARSSRLMLVVTGRADEADAATVRDSPLLGAPEVRRIALEPLAARDTAALVDASLGTERLPEAIYDWVHEKSGGSPGRVAEWLRHLVAERVLRYRDGDWKPSLPALQRLASAPSELDDLMAQRLHQLPGTGRAALEALAVAAEPVDLAMLAALLESSEDAVYEGVGVLVAHGFAERLTEASGARYAMARRGLGEAVEAGLDAGRRQSLHFRLAERLAERSRQGEVICAARAAEHYWRAGERALALPHLLEGAANAAATHGYAEAATLYGRAAEVAAELGDADGARRARVSQADSLGLAGSYSRALRIYLELAAQSQRDRRAEDKRSRSDLMLRAGRLHARLGEHDAALEAFEQALRLLAEAPDAGLEIELLTQKAWALKDRGDSDAAFIAARAALRQAGRLGLPAKRAVLLNTLGMIFYTRGDWRRAGRLVRRGLRAAEASGDDALAVRLRNNLGNVLWKTGDYAAAEDLYLANLAFCERRHDLWGQMTAWNNVGILCCARGDWKGARRPLERSLELDKRLGAREAEARARVNLGEVTEILGDWTRARRHYERVVKLLADAPDHADRAEALAQLGSLARLRGSLQEASELLRDALAVAERGDDQDLLAHCHLQAGLLERDRERYDTAATHLETALALATAADTREAYARLHHALADLALRRGDAEAAARHGEEARSWAERLGDRYEQARAEALAARFAAVAGAADLDERFGRAAKQFEALETPYEYGRVLAEWGMRSADPELQVERLERAVDVFERLGAATEAGRVHGVLEQMREHQRAERDRRVLPGLYETVKIINSTLDLKEVLARAMDIVLERLRAERGMIVFRDELTGDLDVVAARNLGQNADAEGRRLSESVVRRVIERREPVIAVDALADQRFSGADSIVASHILSILCVPLAIRERLVGAIYVDHRRSRHIFGEKDLNFLLAFADQAAMAIDNARLYGEIEAAREKLRAENEQLRQEILSSRHLGGLIGRSRAISELKATLERVAQSTSTVLIRGESGTGKGLVARLLHSVSARRDGPFIQFNAAALPETLVESELFGHERGAFTGATGLKPGRFELANGGTIFIDEIGKVSRSVQAKLLRVVEEKEFERVGGTKTLRSDTRVISATNLNLEEAITRGEFREDLYYRLNIIPIVLPPLRERREDIPYLVQHFLQKIGRDLGQPARQVEPAVLDLFLRHRWAGNVRELEATIHRALVLSHGDSLGPADFAWISPSDAAPPARAVDFKAAPAPPGASYQERLDDLDRQLLEEALERSGGRIREASRTLGIARNTLKAKMKKYGLSGEG
jgi:Nif-specific regulatory protein